MGAGYTVVVTSPATHPLPPLSDILASATRNLPLPPSPFFGLSSPAFRRKFY